MKWDFWVFPHTLPLYVSYTFLSFLPFLLLLHTWLLQTYTGAPPGAKLVQCEIKWVIRILREVRRDQTPFNVPVQNIRITIQHTRFKALPLHLHLLGGIAGLICLVCFYVGFTCKIRNNESSDCLICCWLHFFIKMQRKRLNNWMIITLTCTHRTRPHWIIVVLCKTWS